MTKKEILNIIIVEKGKYIKRRVLFLKYKGSSSLTNLGIKEDRLIMIMESFFTSQITERLRSWQSKGTSTPSIILTCMLHKDFKEIMTPEEVVDLAYAEFAKHFDAGDEMTITIGSDDGGRTLDFFVIGDHNATFLRKELPPTYNGYRTVVIFRDHTLIDKE